MTVKELIEELQSFNPDALVEVRDRWGEWGGITSVMTPWLASIVAINGV